MLLDDRRIVLSLEAICWCTAAMVFLQQTDFPSAIAILPLLMAVLIHVEYAPPAPHSASRSACRSACHSTASCEPHSPHSPPSAHPRRVRHMDMELEP